jgi:hypothetical protein
VKPEKMKKVKARILDDNGDLVFALIEVPESDKRPAFDPKTMRLNDSSNIGEGNPQAGKPGAVSL